VHGGSIDRRRKIEEGDKGNKEEALEPIMMDEDHIKRIMETTRKTCNGVPYQYKVNTKKRVVDVREGLASDEDEVEELQVVDQIEEILRATYERNMRGPREEIEGNTPIHISVNVEPINLCVTITPRIKPPFRQPNFRRRKIVRSTSTQGTTTGGASSGRSSQVSTPCICSSSTFRMEGHDPTIMLSKFKGKASKDPKKHLFIYENIWEAKKIKYEDTKLAQLAITLRYRALD
jgi:hypothetical protein